jgi:arylsulfatase A-like enzyme
MRRRAILLPTLALLALLADVPACGSDSGGAPGPPNLVLIITDDLDTASPFWDAMPKTRALIRDRGMEFTNTFATNPLCCPARATILTGKYPHNTEVFDSVTGLDNFRARAAKTSIGVRLQQHGYRTAFLGKYLNGYEIAPTYVPPGWDEWFGLAGKKFTRGFDYSANHNGRIETFGAQPRDYQTDVLRRLALRYVGAADQTEGKPFLLTLFPSAPHAPIKAAPRDADNPFTDATPPRSANYDEADVSDKPRWLQLYRKLSAHQVETLTDDYRDRMGSLAAVDDMVSAIADRLETDGQLDNTVFVFGSDNGYSFGSHRVYGKLVPYEESIRVPLAIAGPGVAHGRTAALAIHPDIAATLYDLAGAAVPADVDGRSLVPLLGGGSPAWDRKDLLVEYRGTYSANVQIHTYADVAARVRDFPFSPKLIADYRAVRTTRWKYVQWYSDADHDYELYDLRADPHELANLLADPGTAAELRPTTDALQRRMDALAACSGRSCR